jgi:tetratricopeptide (TPR) repeat protein
MNLPSRIAADTEAARLFKAGVLARQQGRLDAAASALAAALALAPQQAQIWAQLGEVREELGLLDGAETCFRQAATLRPDFAAAHYNQARLLRQRGEPEAAARSLNLALACPTAAPTLRAQVLQLLALLQDEAGQLETALATLDAALMVAPERAAIHHNRGVLLQRLARYPTALLAHDRALSLGLDAADAHYNRGNTLQSLGRSDEALAAYRSALEREPQHGLALFDIARLRWRQGDPAFTADLDAAAAAVPTSAVALGLKGRLLLRAERYADAAEAYQLATARADDAPGHFDGLGQALSRLGRHDEALAAHRRAVTLAPQQAATHIGHATSLLQAGQAVLAAQAAETAVRLAPLDQQAWATLSLAWRATGHPGASWLDDYAQHVQAYDLPPPDGWSDMPGFNRALAEALEAMHTDAQAPIDQTLRHGSQTMDNLFDQGHPLVEQLKGRISQAIDQYIAHLDSLPADDSHPLRGRTSPRWRYTDSWSSRLRSNGFHTNHVHGHGWISSCYYVALPPVMTAHADGPSTRAGWITFGTPDISIPGCNLSPRRQVQPRVGRLVLFPSFMWHGTLPFTDTQPRLTIAFDVMPVD